MNLRAVTLQDANQLLQWRNDPRTVASLPVPCTISDQIHEAWLRQRVDLPYFYMVEDHNGTIGTGRLDSCYLISVTVAPEHRRVGYGTPLIRLVADQVQEPVLARIVPENRASVKAFTRAGFHRDRLEWYVK